MEASVSLGAKLVNDGNKFVEVRTRIQLLLHLFTSSDYPEDQ